MRHRLPVYLQLRPFFYCFSGSYDRNIWILVVDKPHGVGYKNKELDFWIKRNADIDCKLLNLDVRLILKILLYFSMPVLSVPVF